jgi:hypothetical protein
MDDEDEARIKYEEAKQRLSEAKRRFDDAERQTTAALTAYRNARDRAEAGRILTLWKYRAFMRLRSTDPESADELVRWIDACIRPFVIRIQTDYFSRYEDKYILFKTTFSTASNLPVFVELPSARRPFGEIKPVQRFGQNYLMNQVDYKVDYKFSERSPPWSDPAPVPDRFAVGYLALAACLTSPKHDFRHMASTQSKRPFIDADDRPASNWLERRERRLLMPKPPRNKRRRRKLGLIEFWSARLPTVVCQLIFDYSA